MWRFACDRWDRLAGNRSRWSFRTRFRPLRRRGRSGRAGAHGHSNQSRARSGRCRGAACRDPGEQGRADSAPRAQSTSLPASTAAPAENGWPTRAILRSNGALSIVMSVIFATPGVPSRRKRPSLANRSAGPRHSMRARIGRPAPRSAAGTARAAARRRDLADAHGAAGREDESAASAAPSSSIAASTPRRRLRERVLHRFIGQGRRCHRPAPRHVVRPRARLEAAW